MQPVALLGDHLALPKVEKNIGNLSPYAVTKYPMNFMQEFIPEAMVLKQ